MTKRHETPGQLRYFAGGAGGWDSASDDGAILGGLTGVRQGVEAAARGS